MKEIKDKWNKQYMGMVWKYNLANVKYTNKDYPDMVIVLADGNDIHGFRYMIYYKDKFIFYSPTLKNAKEKIVERLNDKKKWGLE